MTIISKAPKIYSDAAFREINGTLFIGIGIIELHSQQTYKVKLKAPPEATISTAETAALEIAVNWAETMFNYSGKILSFLLIT